MDASPSPNFNLKKPVHRSQTDLKRFDIMFCQAFGCDISEFYERAFWRLLYSHAKLPALLIRKVHPTFFKADVEFLEDLGRSTDMREANMSAVRFQGINAWSGSLLRNGLKVRVSGRKATDLAQRLFGS